MPPLNRRRWMISVAGAALLRAQQDWLCPMDPDIRSDKPGVCPRCGMKLVLTIPERLEYPLEIRSQPEVILPGRTTEFSLQVVNPETGKAATRFELVHEKRMHLFVVSENLDYFAHEHPILQTDGTFKLALKLPYGGMYRLLADFYPTGSVPQLALQTVFTAGRAPAAKLEPSLGPSKAANLTAALATEPAEPLAGIENRLTFSLTPATDLELYLGAWGHMLAASEDLLDLLHVHPFLARGGAIQFNVVFPQPGLYRIWTQFQRGGVVNTTVFTVPVGAL